MEEYRDEYILVHHGVKGMKWGVRKTKIKSKSSKKKSSDTQHSDGDKVTRRAKRGKRIAIGVLASIGAMTVAAVGVGVKVSLDLNDIADIAIGNAKDVLNNSRFSR